MATKVQDVKVKLSLKGAEVLLRQQQFLQLACLLFVLLSCQGHHLPPSEPSVPSMPTSMRPVVMPNDESTCSYTYEMKTWTRVVISKCRKATLMR
jgi:hypothetical protein